MVEKIVQVCSHYNVVAASPLAREKGLGRNLVPVHPQLILYCAQHEGTPFQGVHSGPRFTLYLMCVLRVLGAGYA
jgi:hypothetical protein